jgi:hypothetical protein
MNSLHDRIQNHCVLTPTLFIPCVELVDMRLLSFYALSYPIKLILGESHDGP